MPSQYYIKPKASHSSLEHRVKTETLSFNNLQSHAKIIEQIKEILSNLKYYANTFTLKQLIKKSSYIANHHYLFTDIDIKALHQLLNKEYTACCRREAQDNKLLSISKCINIKYDSRINQAIKNTSCITLPDTTLHVSRTISNSTCHTPKLHTPECLPPIDKPNLSINSTCIVPLPFKAKVKKVGIIPASTKSLSKSSVKKKLMRIKQISNMESLHNTTISGRWTIYKNEDEPDDIVQYTNKQRIRKCQQKLHHR